MFCGNFALHPECAPSYSWNYLDQPDKGIYLVDVRGMGLNNVNTSLRSNIYRRGSRLRHRRSTERTVTLEFLLCECSDCSVDIEEFISSLAHCPGNCEECLTGYHKNMDDDGDLCTTIDRGQGHNSCVLSWNCCSGDMMQRRGMDVTFIGQIGESEKIRSDDGTHCWRVSIRFIAENPLAFDTVPVSQCIDGEDIEFEEIFYPTDRLAVVQPPCRQQGVAEFTVTNNGDTDTAPLINVVGPACVRGFEVNGSFVEVDEQLIDSSKMLTFDPREVSRIARRENGDIAQLPINMCWDDMLMPPKCDSIVRVHVSGYTSADNPGNADVTGMQVCVTHYDQFRRAEC